MSLVPSKEQQIEDFKKQMNFDNNIINLQQKEIDSLKAEIEKKDRVIAELKRANDFYADSKKYITTTVSRGGESWTEYPLDDDGGKLAREVKAKVEGME